MATKYLYKTAGGDYLKLGNSYIAIPDPSIYANDTFIPFVPAGGFQDVSVLSTFMNSWNPSSGAASWITFSNIVDNGGDGWGSFRATASSNSGTNRTGTINVKARYNNWAIDVSQNAPSDSISINNTYGVWNAAGSGMITGSNSTTVTSSSAWSSNITYINGSGWFTRNPTTGNSGQLVSMSCTTNSSGSSRQATLTFTCGTASVNFAVTQIA
jgi:hypothetical protein